MRPMYQKLIKNNAFTMMEFVVTVAILGTLLSVALPSYHSTTLMVQEKTSLSKMHTIRETFFQYFYRTHMDGDPHFPLTPTNTDTLMDESWANTPIDPQVSLKTPADLFSDGKVPKNANNQPFKYSTWKDTISSTGEIRYFIRITDVDTESAAFGKSFTHSI